MRLLLTYLFSYLTFCIFHREIIELDASKFERFHGRIERQTCLDIQCLDSGTYTVRLKEIRMKMYWRMDEELTCVRGYQ